MSLLSTGAWAAACWLAAGLDARHVEAILWLTQCAQAEPTRKFLSIYSLSHTMAFPYSFSLMILMSGWHIVRQAARNAESNVFFGTAAMWLSMYPVCLFSEQIASRISTPVGAQLYAFLMLIVGSAVMLFFNHKNSLPKRGTR